NLNGQGDCSIIGNMLPMSSKHSASFAADWRQPVNENLEFFVNADLSYSSKKAVQVHNLAWTPEATLLGARIGLSGENWTVALYGKNLTNEDAPVLATRWLSYPFGLGYSRQVALNPAADQGTPRAFFGALRRERQVGLEASFSF
ncbi:MAG: TonB-dependent receptor, partial [Steroidobacteraceae bacterium]|nr:TonB-dependent receptor [Steroidobacteraceae bacterium]